MTFKVEQPGRANNPRGLASPQGYRVIGADTNLVVLESGLNRMEQTYERLSISQERIAETPNFYYYRRLNTSEPKDTDEQPSMSVDMLELFYGKVAVHAAREMYDAQRLLYKASKLPLPNEMSPAVCKRLDHQFLLTCGIIVATMNRIIDASITNKSGRGGLTGIQITQLDQLSKKVGRKKKTNFIVTLRAYAPRFMTLGMSPDQLANGVDIPQEGLAAWRGYHNTPIQDLWHFSDEPAGTTLHEIVRCAEALVNVSASYEVRARAISFILKHEREHPEEISFFHYIFAACHQIAPPHTREENSGLGRQIDRFIQDTFQQLIQKADTSASRLAWTFLDELQASYGQSLPSLLAAALCRLDTTGQNFLTEVLHALQSNTNLGLAILEAVENIDSTRRVLFNQEATKLLVGLPHNQETIPLAQLTRDLLDEEEECNQNVSFTHHIAGSAAKRAADIQIDVYSDQITTQVEIKTNSGIRTIKFQTIISADTEPITTTDTLYEVPSQELLQICTAVLHTALSEHIKRSTANKIKKSVSTVLNGTAKKGTDTASPVQHPTRAERIRAHNEGELAEKTPQPSAAVKNGVDPLSHQETTAAHKTTVVVRGSDLANIQALLEEGKARDILPMRIQGIILHYIQMAESKGGFMPAKPITRHETASILQINMKLFGQAIRLYLVPLDSPPGSRVYQLIGILHKFSDSGERQVKFIDHMFSRAESIRS